MADGGRIGQDGKKVLVDTDDTLITLGQRIREIRAERNLTLQTLAQRTGLSPSMLSLVERGKTSPSIGTLVAIASALGMHMSDLFAGDALDQPNVVVRRGEQPVYEASQGVTRRIVRADYANGVEIAINDYEPGTGSGPEPTRHGGVEFGILLEGSLTVEVNGVKYQLGEGDCISYESMTPHRIWNEGPSHARAVWVNLDRQG